MQNLLSLLPVLVELKRFIMLMRFPFCVLSSGMLALFADLVTFGSSLAVSFSSSDATLLMHYSRSFSDLLTYDVEQLSHTTLHLMRELEFEMLGFFWFYFQDFWS